MAAPWRVVLNKHILGWILHDAFEGLAHDDSETVSCGLLRDGLRLEMGLKVARLEVRDELGDIGARHALDVTTPVELKHILAWLDDSHRWQVVLGDADKLGQACLDAVRDTRGDEENLALEVFSGSLENTLVILAFLLCEENQSALVVTEDGLNVVLAEGDEAGHG